MRSSHLDRNLIDAILCAARRRRALIFALEQAAFAISLVLASAILMLLLGTQILAWYWLVFAAGIGFAFVILRGRSRPIPPYRLAQILDHRLKLSDSLSTAWFLLTHGRGDDPFARFQIERAEKIASSLRPAAAFPFAGRRRWALSATLAAIALSLFTVRYLVTNSLSLQPSLVPMQFGPVLEALERPFLTAERSIFQAQHSPLSQPAEGESESQQTSASTLRPESGKPSGVSAQATAENSKAASDAKQTAAASQAGASSSRDAQQPTDPSPASQGSAHGSEQASLDPNASGLLSRMKDALSSLMAKLRPNASSPQAAPNPQDSAQAQKSADQAALGKDQRGNQQNAQSERASDEQNTAGQAQGDTAEKSQAAQGRTSSSSSPEQNNPGKQSGIGRQDGDKQIKEAEELRAMGKLAEIIGKRSANLTGDMTVETLSQNQQLKTEYSQRLGHHSDSGGAIDRDEIPLMYQQYVRDYMQAVRKPQADAASTRTP